MRSRFLPMGFHAAGSSKSRIIVVSCRIAVFAELKLRDDAPTELMRPLACQDFVILGISFP
jgi:hypothetical protein